MHSENNGESLCISVEHAARLLNIGRSLAYSEARALRLPGVIRIGNRYVVSKKRLLEAINGDGAGDKTEEQQGKGGEPCLT